MKTDLAYGAFKDQFPSFYDHLKKRYSEQGRHYHTWTHVEALLAHLASVCDLLNNPAAVELAVYYHDAVYQPFSKTNEHDSARLLERDLGEALPGALVAEAVCLIEATAEHLLPDSLFAQGKEAALSDCGYFLDMDIAILGADRALYDWYEQAIRAEYADVPTPLFCAGRGKILGAFLARETIFFTSFFSGRFDAKARENLERALTTLKKSAP